MKRLTLALAASLLALAMFASVTSANGGPSENSCWGQASAIFAQTGEMGSHASSFATPRLGLRNLARALAEDGVIPDDSMQSLGIFVAEATGLSIEACGT